MSETWKVVGTRVGMPVIETFTQHTTVRVTARAMLAHEDRPRNAFDRDRIRKGGADEAIDATVVLRTEECDLPGERPEAHDVKTLVAKAIDRAINEARAAAEAFIAAVAAEPPATAFDAAALRDAYRLGYERGSYDANAPTLKVDDEHYRFCEGHDLKPHLGEPAEVAAAA